MVLQQKSTRGADRGVVGPLRGAGRFPDHPERRGERRRFLHVRCQQFRGQRNFRDQINGIRAVKRSRAADDTDRRSGEIRLSGNYPSSIRRESAFNRNVPPSSRQGEKKGREPKKN